jgi:hypothetical protein
VYFIRKPAGELSLQAAAPAGFEGTIEDYVGVAEAGNLVAFLPREEESLFGVSLKHGRIGTYQNHKCRCGKCRGSYAEYRRGKRAEAREVEL